MLCLEGDPVSINKQTTNKQAETLGRGLTGFVLNSIPTTVPNKQTKEP